MKGRPRGDRRNQRALLTQGVREDIWSEPIINIPKELGPYAYSTINVRLDMHPERA